MTQQRVFCVLILTVHDCLCTLLGLIASAIRPSDDRQALVAVKAGRRRRVDARSGRRTRTRGEVLLVDAVAQAVGDAPHDGAPDLARCHLAQLGDALIRIEGGVWGAQYVGAVLEGT